MTKKEAIKASGHTEHWLRNHSCSWCGQTALRMLMVGCGATYERCEPADRQWTGTEKNT